MEIVANRSGGKNTAAEMIRKKIMEEKLYDELIAAQV